MEPDAAELTPAAPSSGGAEPTLRSLGLSVYLPTLVFAIGQGAVIPIVALVAKDLGASVATAGLVVALRGIGTLAFDIPAGTLVARLGERRAMAVGTIILLVSLVGCVLSPNVALFAVFMFLMGCSWAVWLLARLAYVSDVMPPHLRGRALSMLGGFMRIGNFIGPFVGAAAVEWIGLDGAYYVHIALGLVGCVLLFLIPDPHSAAATVVHGSVPLRAIGRAHAHVWLTAGIGALAIGLLRASRQVVLPLWADHVGVTATAVSVIFGLSSGIDMLLFYPAGSVSDRYGRKYVALPCMSLLALGFALLPLTRGFWPLVLVGLLLGFGNGLGAGIVMTLGADFAPEHGKAEFLGLWRLVGDVGTAGGPLLVSAVAGLAGLGPSSIVVAAVGWAGALVVATRMEEPLRAARPARAPTRSSVQPAESRERAP